MGVGRELLINAAVLALHLIRNLTVVKTAVRPQTRSMKFNTALSVAGAILLNIAGKILKKNFNMTKLCARLIVFVLLKN